MKERMFYEDLKEHRKSLGISLDQVASRTKISREFLEKFESGDFSGLPTTYIRLFLRAYAQEIGKDPDSVLADFNAFTGQPEEKEPESEKEDTLRIPLVEKKIVKTSDKKRVNVAAITVAILVTFFIIMVLKQVLIDETEETSTVPLGSNEMSLQTEAQDSETVARDDIRTSAEEESQTADLVQPLTLTLSTNDSCWIRLIVDSKDTTQALYPPDVTRRWQANQRFDIRLGRPSVVDLILNGKNLGPLGAEGIPTRLIITKEGIVRRQAL